MTDTDIKKVARRVLEEIFPADDENALAEAPDPGAAGQMAAAASR